MTALEEFPLWRDGTRVDGISVRCMSPAHWMIVSEDGTRSRSTCPCCDLPLKTQRIAMSLADAMFPTRGGSA